MKPPPILFDALAHGRSPGAVPVSRVRVGEVVRILVLGDDVAREAASKLSQDYGGAALPDSAGDPIPTWVRVLEVESRTPLARSGQGLKLETPFWDEVLVSEAIEDDLLGETDIQAGQRIPFLRRNVCEILGR